MHQRVVCSQLDQPLPPLAVIQLGIAPRELHHALVLRPQGDKVVHGRVVVALHIRPQELATLRDADGVEAMLKLFDGLELQRYLLDLHGLHNKHGTQVNLVIDIVKEGAAAVLRGRVPQHNRMDKDCFSQILLQ